MVSGEAERSSGVCSVLSTWTGGDSASARNNDDDDGFLLPFLAMASTSAALRFKGEYSSCRKKAMSGKSKKKDRDKQDCKR